MYTLPGMRMGAQIKRHHLSRIWCASPVSQHQHGNTWREHRRMRTLRESPLNLAPQIPYYKKTFCQVVSLKYCPYSNKFVFRVPKVVWSVHGSKSRSVFSKHVICEKTFVKHVQTYSLRTHVYIYINTLKHVYRCIYIYIYKYVYTQIFRYTCCKYVHIYIYIYIFLKHATLAAL